ncbi:MAG: thioredoxin-like domain-containing protein [Planctomycetota bacterium]
MNKYRCWQLALTLVICLGGCDQPAEQSKSVTTNPASTTAGPGAAHASEKPTPQPDTTVKPVTPAAPDKAESPEATTTKLDLKDMGWEQLQELVASHKGKVVVVDVWSTACEPCLREFPRLVELQKRHPNDVVCISFDCDFAGVKNKPVGYYRERVMKALTEMKAETVINVMSTLAADELFQKIDLDSIPAVYVYNQQGDLAKRFDNRTPASETEEGISYELQIDPLVAKLVIMEKAGKN